MKIFKSPVSLPAQQNEALLAMLPDKAVFWDIETTGFSRRYDSVYLMGYLYWEGTTPYIEQHLASSTADEIALLEGFLQKMDDFEALVTFNGDAFDLPSVQERLRQMRIPGALKKLDSLDLYKQYRPYAPFFGWKSCRLKALETFLGLVRQDQMDGGELIEVFYEYSRTEDLRLEKTLLLHNYEDLLNLPHLLKIGQYVHLLKTASVIHLAYSDRNTEIDLSFSLGQQLPLNVNGQFFVHKKSVPIAFRTEDQTKMIFTLPIYSSTMKYYLPNYKEYYMLPSGQLLHKSLGIPPLKKTATKAECYIAKDSRFLPMDLQENFAGLHCFRINYKDKNQFLEFSELEHWILTQNPENFELLFHTLLPFM